MACDSVLCPDGSDFQSHHLLGFVVGVLSVGLERQQIVVVDEGVA